MDRPARSIYRRRTRYRSYLEDDSGTNPNPPSSAPGDQLIRIDITFTLPRRLAWLLAGIAVGNLDLPNGLLEKASTFLRVLLHS